MEKTMSSVTVSVNDNQIVISQPNLSSGYDGVDAIYLNPGQVDLLILWIEEARKEITELQGNK